MDKSLPSRPSASWISSTSRDTQITSDADLAFQLQIEETKPSLPPKEPGQRPSGSRAPDNTISEGAPSSDRKLAEEIQSLEDESAAFVILAQDLHGLELLKRKENNRKGLPSSSTPKRTTSCCSSEPNRPSPAGERTDKGRTLYFRGYTDQNASHCGQGKHSRSLESGNASENREDHSSTVRTVRREIMANEGRNWDRLLPDRVHATEVSPAGSRMDGDSSGRILYFNGYREQNASHCGHVRSSRSIEVGPRNAPGAVNLDRSSSLRAEQRGINANEGRNRNRLLPARNQSVSGYQDQNAPYCGHINSSFSAELEAINASFTEYLERGSTLRAQRREIIANQGRSGDRLNLNIDEAAVPSPHVRQRSRQTDRDESTRTIVPRENSVNLDFDSTLDWPDVHLGWGGGTEWELGSGQQHVNNNPPSNSIDSPVHTEGVSTFDMLPGDETYEELLALSDIIGPAKETGASEGELDRLPCKRVVLQTNSGRTPRTNDIPKPYSPRGEEVKRKWNQATIGSRSNDNQNTINTPLRSSPPFENNNSERTAVSDRDICVPMGTTCNICLVEYKNGDTAIVLTGCEHMFHAGCLKPWLRTKKTCPIDRQAIMVSPNRK